jgi:hypothetical protein
MIWKNIARRIGVAILLLENANTKGITTSDKSSYYRSALIILSTVVEGLSYELVKKETLAIGNIIGTRIEKIERQKISKVVLSTSNDFCICEKIKSNININDIGVDFGTLNSFIKNKHLVTDLEYKLLNWVRIERNKIHLQSLTVNDTGYTRYKINKMSKAIKLLMDKM